MAGNDFTLRALPLSALCVKKNASCFYCSMG
jgi:hypothetical protein